MSATGALLYAFIIPATAHREPEQRRARAHIMKTNANPLFFGAVAFAAAAVSLFVSMMVAGPARAADAATPVAAYVETLE